MDDPNPEALEANWVFVEEVDIAEEAVQLNEEQFESNKVSQKYSDRKIEFNHTENPLLEYDECLNKSDSPNMESDVDSDGISIISNWSCSQGTPEIESLDDSSDNKDIEEKQEQTGADTPEVFEEDSICKIPEQINCEPKEVVEINEIPGKFEVEADIEPSDTSDLPLPTLPEEKIVEYEQDQLRWLNEPPQGTEDTSQKHTLHKYTPSNIPQYIKKHFNVSGFLIGTAVIAVSSVFLGRYFTLTDPIQEELPTYQEKVFLYDLPGDENFDVPTALSFCREKHKTDDIYREVNAQKCLSKIEKRMKRKKEEKIMKENIHSWKKQLEIKEKYLTQREENLIKRETQLNSKSSKYKENVAFENQFQKGRGFKNFSKEEELKRSGKTLENMDLSHKNRDKDKDIKGFKVKIQHFVRKQDNYKGNKQYKQHKVNFKRNRNEFKEINKEFDDNKKRYIYSDEDKRKYDEQILKNVHKSERNKRDFEYSSKEKTLDADERKKTNLYSNANNSCQNCKNSKNKCIKKAEQNFLLVNKKNDTIDSNWLDKLFKGRNDLRKKDHSGEWYFDRSSYRRRKRDKAKWYFDWMMDREILRYRRL